MAYQPQQPMQAMPPSIQQDNGGPWKSSLFDCSPCTSCIVSCCIPCLLVGQTSERMRDPTMQTAEDMNSACLIHGALLCFTGCPWIYLMMKRTEIRERFGIPGSGCGDCCTTYWCHCCAAIQQDNEVKARLLVAGPVQQQYQPESGMVMPQSPPPAQHPPQKEGYTAQ